MGRDKALLSLGGVTLVERGVRTLAAVAEDVAIAGGAPELAAYGRVIRDEHPGCGPLGGIVAGLRQMTAEWGLFLAVDMPFLPVEALDRLLAVETTDEVAVMAETEMVRQPLCGLYSRRALEGLEEQLAAGRWKVTAAVEAVGVVRYVGFEEVEWFRNLNTPEEFEAAGR